MGDGEWREREVDGLGRLKPRGFPYRFLLDVDGGLLDYDPDIPGSFAGSVFVSS